jgi:hypothetical protein
VEHVRCNGHYSTGANHDPCGWGGPRSELNDGCCPTCGGAHLVSES